MNATEFRDAILEFMETEFPALKPAPVRGSTATIKTTAGEFYLDNFRKNAAYHRFTPAQLRKHIRRWITATIEGGQIVQSKISFQQAKARLFPQISPFPSSPGTTVLLDAIVPGLQVVLVLDAKRTMRYIISEDLQAWNQQNNEQQLYKLAKSNLRRKTVGDEIVCETLHPSGKVISFDANDGYAAARILLPSWRRRLGRKLGFPFWFGVPVRDLLLCWSDDVAPKSLEEIGNTVLAVYQKLDHPLVPFIYRVQADLRISLAGVVGNKRKSPVKRK